MKLQSLLRRLAAYYPKRLAEPWDYVGYQTGVKPEEVHKVFLCLDFDYDCMKMIEEEKPDLIISHHPFFFGRKKEILETDTHKKELDDYINENGLCIYSYHTNFDNAPEGMNDEIARELGLLDYGPLETVGTAYGGRLPYKMKEEEFANYVVKKLGLPYGFLLGWDREVETVALLGGAGSSYWKAALFEGYDAFISSDINHPRRRDIIGFSYTYLEIPHEVEEKAFLVAMERTLKKIDPSLEVVSLAYEIKELPKIIKG